MIQHKPGKTPLRPLRPGFTVLETSVAIGLLALGIAATAQLGVWVLAERSRNRDQQAALELAANVLEAARASRWETLTPAWAAEQRVPTIFEERGWQLTVRVAEEPKRPHLKRVSVQVHIPAARGGMGQPIELTTLFAAAAQARPGGKP
jgi:type II secretory pathway pseudopilin PulG